MAPPFIFSPVKLIYGGDALGFHAGHTVMAPRLLPGEQVEAEEVRRIKGVIHARPVRVLEPSPERIDARCPYFGNCGGCHYQHFDHQTQVESKTAILRETLFRLGKATWEAPIPAHTGPEWNYRNQAQFKIGQSPDGLATLGFFEAESNRLVEIDACPILSPTLNALLAVLRTEPWTRALAGGKELALLADDRDEKVMLTLAGTWNAQEEETLAGRSLGELGQVRTVAFVRNDRHDGARVFGEPHLSYRVGEFTYQISPTAFFQNARFLLPDVVESVTGAESGETAIDLYAGVGLFTLPLARRFNQVLAVEAHPPAAADLAVNARAASGKIRTSAATAYDFLRRCAQMDPDLVVMDPPRAGMGAETLRLLVDLRPKRLHYLSCSPPTLARDLDFLLKRGYQLDSVELFDFFPQTYHIESLARLSRIGRETAQR